MCRGATILTKGRINKLLEFHFQRQPGSSYHPTPNGRLQITKSCCFKFQKKSFSCTRTTLLNIGQVIRKCIFYSAFMCRLAEALQRYNFFAENRVVEQRNTEDVVCSFVLLLRTLIKQQSNYMHFFQILLRLHLWCACMTDFAGKVHKASMIRRSPSRF